MKEKAKLVKQHRERKVHQLGKRLGPEEEKMGDDHAGDGAVDKRKNLGGGQAQVIHPQPVPKVNGGGIPK